MSLFIRSILYTIIPGCWMVWLKSVLHNSISWIPDRVSGFVGTPHFGTSFDWFWGPVKVFFVSRNYSAPPFGLITFGAPLSLCAINTSLWVT